MTKASATESFPSWAEPTASTSAIDVFAVEDSGSEIMIPAELEEGRLNNEVRHDAARAIARLLMFIAAAGEATTKARSASCATWRD